MDTNTRETVTTQEDGTGSTTAVSRTSTGSNATVYRNFEYLVYFFFGAIEILLAFRFFFKLTGASNGSGFVNFIYSLSDFFVRPFEGIFRSGTTQGLETTAVFEFSTIVALLVFAVLAWGVVKFIRLISGKSQPSAGLLS